MFRRNFTILIEHVFNFTSGLHPELLPLMHGSGLSIILIHILAMLTRVGSPLLPVLIRELPISHPPPSLKVHFRTIIHINLTLQRTTMKFVVSSGI